MRSFFWLGFNPYVAEQLLRGVEFQEKEEKDENHREELFRKNPRKKGAY